MKLERAFTLSVTLVALWGFIMLYLTGEFPAIAILPAFPVLVGAFLARRWLMRIPSFVWDLVTLVGFALILPIARASLLNATVYFFLFLQTVKVLSMRRPRDAFSVYVISFFQVLAAAVLTTSPAFGFAFILYAGLLTWSLVLTTMLVSAASVARLIDKSGAPTRRFAIFSSESSLPDSVRKLHVPTLHAIVLVLTVVIIGIALGVFVVTPRFATRRLLATLGAQGQPPAVSAFDESVEFGAYEKIQLDNTVAMYVRPDDPESRLNTIRLRGVALDRFDGRRWRRTTWTTDAPPFPRQTIREYVSRWNTIIQPPNTTRFLFGETFPQRLVLEFDQPVLSDPHSAAAWLPYVPAKEIHYRVMSRVEALEAREPPEKYQRPIFAATANEGDVEASTHPVAMMWRFAKLLAERTHEVERAWGNGRAPGQMLSDTISLGRPPGLRGTQRIPSSLSSELGMAAPRYLEACLQIPEHILDPKKLRALAQQIVRDRKSSYEKAMALESYLRTRYEYSLEQLPKNSQNPVEEFLFRSKRGHCEYFATAMVMLLRSLDIPARIVNGYVCSEWNHFAKSFTVRQRDAHSWVEVFFPGYGWMTFDPTPPGALHRGSDMNPYFLTFSRLWDSIKLRWYRAMIDFSIEDQRFVVGTFLRMLVNSREEIVPEVSTRGVASNGTEDIEPKVLAVVALVGGVGLFVLLARATRKVRPPRLKKSQSAVWPPPAEFYAQLLWELQRLGWKRAPHETPLEFAKRVATVPDLAAFTEITTWYYEYRYGQRRLRETELRAITDLRAKLHHNAKKK